MMSSSKGQGCAECEEKESGEKGKGPRFCGGFIAVCIELRRKKGIREGISYFRLAQWLGPLGDSLLCFASLSSLGSQNCQNLGYTLYQPTRYRNDDATYAMHTAIYSNAPVLLPPSCPYLTQFPLYTQPQYPQHILALRLTSSFLFQAFKSLPPIPPFLHAL